MDDAALIRRACAGDHEAAGRLWQANRRWVAAVLLAHKPVGTDLEDLLQEVALAVVEKLGQLDDPAAFRGWLRSVAVNAARATGRKRTRRRGLLRLVRAEPDCEPAPGAWTDPGAVERAERSRRLVELVQELPEAYRECVLLRCVRGMSHAQIAEITGLPETTVETRIARGRRRLRELAEQASEERGAQAVMP
ncbi:MAG: RNA polymerase sigma factor [Phycisphaerales bacterium]